MRDQLRKILQNRLTREREILPLLPEGDKVSAEELIEESLQLNLERAWLENSLYEIKEYETMLELWPEILAEEEAEQSSNSPQDLKVVPKRKPEPNSAYPKGRIEQAFKETLEDAKRMLGAPTPQANSQPSLRVVSKKNKP